MSPDVHRHRQVECWRSKIILTWEKVKLCTSAPLIFTMASPGCSEGQCLRSQTRLTTAS